MKKIFERVNEELFIETLDNGITVYMYPTKKTKNFYMSISVKYGARVNKYKVNNKEYYCIPGSAHFLEHKVMALSENTKVSEKINSLGSLANAWTSYRGTNYNIFGSENPVENLRILLDLFYNPNITEESVEKEKGIIGEEIDMYKDQIDRFMFDQLFNNLFNTSYMKNTVVGERSDINKITSKSLMTIYNHFYIPKNTFITVTGNFDCDEIMNEIKNYIGKLKLSKREVPKLIKTKENDKVNVSYEEINKDTDVVRVKIGIKIPRENFNIKDDSLLRTYLSIVLSSNFSATSLLYENYKNENIIMALSSGANIIDKHIIINLNAATLNPDMFINRIKEDIKHLNMTEEDFERKKRLYLKDYICDFDNIEDVEYIITESIFMDNKLSFKEYSKIKSLDYKTAKEVESNMYSDQVSILRTIK